MRLPGFGTNGGAEQQIGGLLSPRAGIARLRGLINRGVRQVTVTHPDGSHATYQPRKGRWARSLLREIRDTRNRLETY